MKVYVVGMNPLDQGAEASADPEAVFKTEAEAIAWGREGGQALVGQRFWWGVCEDVDRTYDITELELKMRSDR